MDEATSPPVGNEQPLEVNTVEQGVETSAIDSANLPDLKSRSLPWVFGTGLS